jgi:hypothetical protein
VADLSLPLLFAARRRIISAIEAMSHNGSGEREPTVDVILEAEAAALKVLHQAIGATVATSLGEVFAQLELLDQLRNGGDDPLGAPDDAPTLAETITLGVRHLVEARIATD